MKKIIFIFIPAIILSFVPYIMHTMVEGVETPLDADDLLASVALFVMAGYLRYTVYISMEKLQDKARDLERARNFNNMVLSGVADGIYAVDRDMRVTLWSKGAERITGHKAADVIGRPCKDFLSHTEEDGTPLCGTSNCPLTVMDTGNILSEKIVTAHKDNGQRMLVSVTAAPLQGNETVIGAVEAFRDAAKERELRRIKESLTNMLIHDFKNPISVIGVVLETMRGAKKEINERFIKMAYQAVGELDNMVVNLLEIAKMEKGFELNREVFSIEDMLIEAANKAEVMAMAGGQRIISDIKLAPECFNQGTDMPKLYADRYLLMRVLENLLGNAVKFTPPGGEITLSGCKEDGMFRIAVADTGPGIPKQFHELIFDKYWQAKDESKNVRKGVGLGLAFCKMAVEAHGGRIRVESEEGKGSTFIVTVPI